MLEEVASGVNHMHALELALLYKQKATAKAREPGSVWLEPRKPAVHTVWSWLHALRALRQLSLPQSNAQVKNSGTSFFFSEFLCSWSIDKMLNFVWVPLQLK